MGDAMLEAAHDHHMIGDHATLQQAHAPVRERSIQHSVQTSPDRATGSLTLQHRPKRASRIEHHEVGSGMHGKSELSLHRALIVGPSTDM